MGLLAVYFFLPASCSSYSVELLGCNPCNGLLSTVCGVCTAIVDLHVIAGQHTLNFTKANFIALYNIFFHFIGISHIVFVFAASLADLCVICTVHSLSLLKYVNMCASVFYYNRQEHWCSANPECTFNFFILLTFSMSKKLNSNYTWTESKLDVLHPFPLRKCSHHHFPPCYIKTLNTDIHLKWWCDMRIMYLSIMHNTEWQWTAIFLIISWFKFFFLSLICMNTNALSPSLDQWI